MNLSNQKIDIGAAATLLGVTTTTLRRWDNSGVLKAKRDSARSHRYYDEDDLENFVAKNSKRLLKIAINWGYSSEPITTLPRFYCETSDLFRVRLSQFSSLLERELKLHSENDFFSLVTSVIGEIGNNAFDHNIGNWPDLPGIFFGYNLNERQVIVVDRGQGVLTTLRRVKPELKTDEDALITAFTEKLSGRYPEKRGNGLKYVDRVVRDYEMNLWFHSGKSAVKINGKQDDFSTADLQTFMQGCFITLNY